MSWLNWDMKYAQNISKPNPKLRSTQQTYSTHIWKLGRLVLELVKVHLFKFPVQLVIVELHRITQRSFKTVAPEDFSMLGVLIFSAFLC